MTEKSMQSTLSTIHIELLQSERTPFTAVKKALETGRREGTDTSYQSNTLGFEYHADEDAVSVYATFSDGADEVTLSFEDFISELGKYRMGGLQC
ncbi:hypothetical protein [Thalassovita mangrovi]|uniref:Uncharacterized protein n=1 Tax=Thalassovita mangrovi TaxID=2692236 RepID=A0A6L8LIG5_9RHOB|nr:hypothetical protein [Thalassovita mangrovi]MYM54230.1 hypothetical protein [Thalassovita mangrovi]